MCMPLFTNFCVFVQRTLHFLHRTLYTVRRLAVLLVVLLTADFPVPCEHGLLAVGLVSLGCEGDLVVGDLREIFLTLRDHRPYRGEACADLQLLRAQRRGTLVRVRILHVETLTVGVGTCSLAVRGYHVVAVVVTVLFLGFLQGAADGLDTTRAYFH